MTAAWGLRKLAVPETLPAQLREIERRWQGFRKPGRVTGGGRGAGREARPVRVKKARA